MLGQRFRDIVKSTVGEQNFLMAGEDPYDLETRYYSLSYFRITPGHIPTDRYDAPFVPIMIAVTGFDDREMINEALRYRYIISYEPFNFKGNLSDFPLTLSYGRKIDAFAEDIRTICGMHSSVMTRTRASRLMASRIAVSPPFSGLMASKLSWL